MQVVTSFYPLYFFANEIAGEKADVTNITPAGSEPHDYEPSPKDIMEIANSKLLILNGRGLETWGEKIMQVINPEKTIVVVASKDLVTQAGAADPHIWLSPALAQIIVGKIKIGIEQADPANSMYYESRASDLALQLGRLDLEYREGLAGCTNRNIVTAHSAFGHLAAAYGLTQVSIAGLSPDAEPSPQQIGGIIQIAKKNNIKYVFFESLASPKLSETIAREVGAKTLVLNPLEGLTPGEVASGKNYFTEMESNLVNIRMACGAR